MEKKKAFYEVPTQVKFLESENIVDDPQWIGGIAFEDKIICGECGSVIEIDDVAEIIELSWVDISELIIEE